MDVDARAAGIGDVLYAVPPEDFTSERDRHVKAARSEGERDLAQAIAVFRRPTRSAWVVNQLVRSRPTEVAELLDVGARLREAQRNLRRDEMRELAAERREAIGSLMAAAREIASESGHGLSESAGREVESTLEAALVDEESAELVRAGRLTEALAYAGFGAVDIGTGATRAAAGKEKSGKPLRQSGEQRTASRTTKPAKKVATDELAGRRAAKAKAEATAAATAAEREAAADAAAVDDLAARHEELAQRISDLDEQLTAARAEYRAAGSELRAARKAAEGSARRARAAQRRLEEIDR